MRKLKLEIDALAVESFAPQPDGRAVVAHDAGPTVPSCPSLNLCPTEDRPLCPVTLPAD